MRERYGNLFDMYEKITGENAYEVPMRIYPAVHYAMGGTWVDYNLMSTLPGLFVIGEANFSDHGANRLGASALMQGLADGYFVLPYTIGNYLASAKPVKARVSHPEFKTGRGRAPGADQQDSGDQRQAHGRLRCTANWANCFGKSAAWPATRRGSKRRCKRIPELREEFWRNVNVTGENGELNQALEYAGRVADFMDFAELLCLDALQRRESCGGHFREEFQSPDGEAMRDDEHFAYVAAWEYQGPGKTPLLHKEPLVYEEVHMSTRSYK